MRPLAEPFEISGHWFVPENHERRVSGTLVYTPERTELRLLGGFQASPLSFPQGALERPVIYGITDKSEPVTILRAARDSGSLRFGAAGLSTPETWLCVTTIYGDFVAGDATFKEMRCRVPGLHVWQAQALVEHSHEPSEDAKTGDTTYRIRGGSAETISIATDNLELDWFIETVESLSAFNIAVKIHGWFAIRPSTPQPLNWFLEQQEKISTLLTLCAGTPMLPDTLEVPGTKPPRQASVLFRRPDVKYCYCQNVHEFFLPRCDLGAEWSQLLQNWLEVYAKVKLPSQLAMSIFGSQELWPHIEFLSLMQALEGFHRGLCDGVYMNPADYEAVEKTIVFAIPRDISANHQAALKSRLRYGNELSLAKRLGELAERLTEPIRLQIFGAGGNVPRTWIDTRNFYTHWDEHLRDKTMNGQQMLDSKIRMTLFLRCLYLDLVGVPAPALSQALSGFHRASQWLIQINARERRVQAQAPTG